jgi:uncharacterized protein YbcV (DUF1398 family)
MHSNAQWQGGRKSEVFRTLPKHFGARASHATSGCYPPARASTLQRTDPFAAQGTPLVGGTVDVSPFNRDALIAALRTDQAGNSSFQEFLAASWRAGVVRSDVDFAARKVTYYGCNGEEYIGDYPAVDVD